MKNPSAKVLGGGLVLALALLLPAPTGEAAPLPPPKKMTLPPRIELILKNVKRHETALIQSLSRSEEESKLIPYARYDYYVDVKETLRTHLDGGPRYCLDRPLTTEERRGMRDLLYRLQREFEEGQANGSVGQESFAEAWRRFKSTKK
jgi:hypothetical protein